jgi:lysozyme family protein
MTATKNPNLLELFMKMEITADPLAVKYLATSIATWRPKYEEVSMTAAAAIPNGSHCPWYVIGLIHLMECSLSWSKHLHNGDPLTDRTTHVPAGRPRKGNPPFTWHQSAVDAIRMLDFNNASYDWTSIPFILQKLEGYNGLGYRSKGIYSPYLWAGTNHYTAGKYAADGKYDPKLVSKQIGVAPILSRLLAMV